MKSMFRWSLLLQMEFFVVVVLQKAICFGYSFGNVQHLTLTSQPANINPQLQLTLQSIKRFPANHPKVLHSVCGSTSAGQLFPYGIASCSDCKWSTNGATNFDDCPSTTTCLPSSSCSNCSTYPSCDGQGYVNAGSLFFAYGFPNHGAPNTGYDDENTTSIFVVEDSQSFLWFVLSHGHARSEQSSPYSRVIIQSTQGVGLQEVSPRLTLTSGCASATVDCVSWNPTLGDGVFVRAPSIEDTSSGLVLGPFSWSNLSIALKWDTQHTRSIRVAVGVDSSNRILFEPISSQHASSGLTISHPACRSNCSTASSALSPPSLSSLNISLAQSLDTDPRAGFISLNLSLVITNAPDNVIGFRIFLVPPSTSQQTTFLIEEFICPSSPATFTLELDGFAANHEAMLQVRPFNFAGDSSEFVGEFVADWARPQDVAVRVWQSNDESKFPEEITAKVSFERPHTENKNRNTGTAGYALFLAITNTTTNTTILGPQIAQISLTELNKQSSDNNTSWFSLDKYPIGSSYNQFVVIAINDRFAANQSAKTDMHDDTGMGHGAYVFLTVLSVAGVCAGGFAGVGMTRMGSSSRSSRASVTVAGRNAIVEASPTLPSRDSVHATTPPTEAQHRSIGGLIWVIQIASLLGRLQSPALPRTFLQFSNAIAWCNGDTAILGDSSSSPHHESNLDSRISRATHGTSGAQLLFRVCAVFSIPVGVACVLCACQLAYCKWNFVVFPSMVKGLRRLQRLVLRVLVGVYYGAVFSALMALQDGSHSSQATKALAYLLLIIFGGGLLVLSAGVALLIRYRTNQLVNLRFGSLVTEHRKLLYLRAVYSPLLDGTRAGYEWYAVLSNFSRLVVALISACVLSDASVQCVLILAVFATMLCINFAFRPWNGGSRSFEFVIETSGQVLAIGVCISLLISNIPNEPVATFFVVAYCLLVGAVSLFAFAFAIRSFIAFLKRPKPIKHSRKGTQTTPTLRTRFTNTRNSLTNNYHSRNSHSNINKNKPESPTPTTGLARKIRDSQRFPQPLQPPQFFFEFVAVTTYEKLSHLLNQLLPQPSPVSPSVQSPPRVQFALRNRHSEPRLSTAKLDDTTTTSTTTTTMNSPTSGQHSNLKVMEMYARRASRCASVGTLDHVSIGDGRTSDHAGFQPPSRTSQGIANEAELPPPELKLVLCTPPQPTRTSQHSTTAAHVSLVSSGVPGSPTDSPSNSPRDPPLHPPPAPPHTMQRTGSSRVDPSVSTSAEAPPPQALKSKSCPQPLMSPRDGDGPSIVTLFQPAPDLISVAATTSLSLPPLLRAGSEEHSHRSLGPLSPHKRATFAAHLSSRVSTGSQLSSNNSQGHLGVPGNPNVPNPSSDTSTTNNSGSQNNRDNNSNNPNGSTTTRSSNNNDPLTSLSAPVFSRGPTLSAPDWIRARQKSIQRKLEKTRDAVRKRQSIGSSANNQSAIDPELGDVTPPRTGAPECDDVVPPDEDQAIQPPPSPTMPIQTSRSSFGLSFSFSRNHSNLSRVGSLSRGPSNFSTHSRASQE